MEYREWRERGVREGFKIMIIILDMEDREYYPVYFLHDKEAQQYSNNLISESKCKIERVIQL